MATKKRTFYAYRILNEAMAQPMSTLKENLFRKLTSDADNFGNRCKSIVRDSRYQDVLACFVPFERTNGFVVGEMWRIGPTKDMPKLPRELFTQQSARADEVPAEPNVSETDMSIMDVHYFMITDNKLITTFPLSRAAVFAKYLNELLSVYRETQTYKFEPLVILPSNIKLSDISAVTFTDRPVSEDGRMKREKSKFGIFKAGASSLKYFFNDYGNTNDLVNERIMSATMTLKFAKPQRMSDETYSQKLSAILKPLSAGDTEGVYFKLTDGRNIKAMEIHAKLDKTFDDTSEENKQNIMNAYTFMSYFLTTL